MTDTREREDIFGNLEWEPTLYPQIETAWSEEDEAFLARWKEHRHSGMADGPDRHAAVASLIEVTSEVLALLSEDGPGGPVAWMYRRNLMIDGVLNYGDWQSFIGQKPRWAREEDDLYPLYRHPPTEPSGERRQAAFPKCGGCNRPYSDPGFMDLIVPDDVWAHISPTGDEGGLLCPGCIISAIIDADQTGEVVFRSGPLSGQRLIIHAGTQERDDG